MSEEITSDSVSPKYKWYILTLAALTHTIAVAIPYMAMPVLFDEISKELGLNLVQVGWVWGISALTGILTGLVGGTLGDRFGTKRVLAVSCILGGMTCALRGLSSDYVTGRHIIYLRSGTGRHPHECAQGMRNLVSWPTGVRQWDCVCRYGPGVHVGIGIKRFGSIALAGWMATGALSIWRYFNHNGYSLVLYPSLSGIR